MKVVKTIMHDSVTKRADDIRPFAILLLGPTGSGKTPLGELIERLGLWKRRCRHFDFGANLRRAVRSGGRGWGLSVKVVAFLRKVLASGALLEDRQFPIALAILSRFLSRSRISSGDIVILNGLPRHIGQARGVETVVKVNLVAELVCPAKIVIGRIGSDAGGDRKGRTDDAPSDIRRKLKIYDRRTQPLVRYYKKRKIKVVRLPVGVKTTADRLWRLLDKLGESDNQG